VTGTDIKVRSGEGFEFDCYLVAPDARMNNVEVHVFPGVEHGYMMKDAKAYDRKTYELSMQRALAILKDLA
jgi:dienelactone hydrolase